MEKLYKYEMHAHDKLCSACAQNTPEEMVKAYYDAGYSGMCFTNHFYLGNTAIDRGLPWKDFVTAYWQAYQRAVKFAADNCPGFSVFFGIEHAYGGGKEILTYGIDLDFLLKHPGLHKYSIKDYCDAVHEYGGYVSNAHPFRDREYIDMTYPLNPEYWDAAEVYNFCNKPEENEKAEEFAKEHGLYRTSGGDEHRATGDSIGKAGLAFPYPIHSGRELVEAMRKRDGRCIINGEVEPKA